jgi:hypothetical protein
MKFSCGDVIDRRKERLAQWHDWFAWHPVCIGTEMGEFRRVWLEKVSRRVLFFRGQAIPDYKPRDHIPDTGKKV